MISPRFSDTIGSYLTTLSTVKHMATIINPQRFIQVGKLELRETARLSQSRLVHVISGTLMIYSSDANMAVQTGRIAQLGAGDHHFRSISLDTCRFITIASLAAGVVNPRPFDIEKFPSTTLSGVTVTQVMAKRQKTGITLKKDYRYAITSIPYGKVLSRRTIDGQTLALCISGAGQIGLGNTLSNVFNIQMGDCVFMNKGELFGFKSTGSTLTLVLIQVPFEAEEHAQRTRDYNYTV